MSDSLTYLNNSDTGILELTGYTACTALHRARALEVCVAYQA